MTTIYALLGDPVARSLSPAFQNAALRRLGSGARYVARRVEDRRALERAAAELRAGELAGANITVPHKLAAFELADAASELAVAVGAANTWAVRDGELVASNTDVAGVVATLEAWQLRPRAVVLLGAGGAAASVVAALRGRYQSLTVVNRTIANACDLATRACRASTGGARHHAVAWGERPALDAVAGADLVIDATSLAHRSPEAASAAYAALELRLLAPGATALSLSYGGGVSPFFEAVSDGVQRIDGLCMLLHQGARSFSLWTGAAPPLAVMRDALAEAAGRSASSIPIWEGVCKAPC